jgi:hypothetical protein
MGLPAVNVGTKKDPVWRFRLATVEAWEAQNERPYGQVETEAGDVKAAAPVAWDGVDRLGTIQPRGPARR